MASALSSLQGQGDPENKGSEHYHPTRFTGIPLVH